MQSVIESYLLLLLKASWQGGALVVLVLALRRLFRERLPPRWRYGLWFLVVLRLALPWTVPAPVSLFNLLNLFGASDLFAAAHYPPAATNRSADHLVKDPKTQPASIDVTARAVGTPPQLGLSASWWLGLWAAGAFGFAGYLLVTHHLLARRIACQRPLIDAAVLNLLEDCKQLMGVRVPVTLVETREVGSPSLFGFVRPRLLLPAGLTRSFSLAELRWVFLHELGHIKRHDILVGWLLTALQLLHWFNPLVWLAFHRMRLDRELACDALALSYAPAEESPRYGHTIIKLLESFGRPAWTPSLAGAVENKNQLEERIRMIATFEHKNRGLGLATALLAGLGLITLTDAQPATSQLEKDLHGSWVLVGRPGEVGAAPAVGGRIKLVTDHSWSVTQADPKTGAVLFHHGGTYTLKGNEYAETVDYANDSTRELVKKTFKFTLTIEGNTLTLIGVGNPWQEVWKRVNSDSTKPVKSETSALRGAWRGREIGGRSAGTVSLLLQESTLEFHGADTNEWYKATFSLYDTSPKQLVAVITDCPAPDYIGKTTYAIYQVQDGSLTLTGNEPGNPSAPAGFDAPGSRKLVLKHE